MIALFKGKNLSIQIQVFKTDFRYKLLSKETWPNPRRGSNRDNTLLILREIGVDQDCVPGKTKIFIRSPQTVFKLEQVRSERIPYVVTFLQKVRRKA
jgi:myosin-1